MKPLEILIKFLNYTGNIENNPEDAIKITNRIQQDDTTGQIRYQNSIPDSTVDQAIALPDAATDYLLIFIDREVTIKMNGGSEVLTLKPRANGVKTFAFFMKGTVSGLSVSNASGAAANVDIISVNS